MRLAHLPARRTARFLPRIDVLLAVIVATAWACVPEAFAQNAAAIKSTPHTIGLSIGNQQELTFEQGVERIAIADETVASVAITRKSPGSAAARILLTGKAAGTTTLMIWEKGQAAAVTYLLQVRRRTAMLEGQTDSLTAHQQARESALASQPEKTPLADHSSVGVRSHTVQVDVKVVEFNRETLKRAGINIFSTRPNRHGFSFGSFAPSSLREASFGSDGSIGGEFARPVSNALSLLFNFGRAGIGLDVGFLEGNGLARVLAEPTLVALSGQSASFLAGGELPIPVPQGLGTVSIEYKPFGVGLNVTPTVLANDRISLKVAPEASDLDYTHALTLNGMSVPAIHTRRADTTVELGDGESFVIGGLVSRTTSSNADKVPFLGDLPVLGAFFKKSSYSVTEKELVIVVTPHLVKPFAKGSDMDSTLPGAAERREGAVWRSILLDRGSIDTLPGFSR